MKNFCCICFAIIISSQVFAGPPPTTFYSKASGNWSNAATWGTSCGAGAGSVPNAGKTAVICSGYTVTVNANITCATIWVNAGGTLIIDGGNNTVTTLTNVDGTIIFNGGTYTTTGFTDIDGTFIMHGGTFNTDDDFEIDATATGTMDGGEINLTGGVVDEFEVMGVFNHSGGNITVAGTTQIQFGGILNISGTAVYTAQGGFELVHGAGGFVNMNGGQMNFWGDVYNNIPDVDFNQTSGIIQFDGTGEWQMKGSYNASGTAKAIFNGTTTLNQLAGGAWNFNDVTINTARTLDQGNADSISVAGDWYNDNGTFVPHDYKVVFNGIENQSLGGTSTTGFYDLTINNSGAVTNNQITLSQPISVNNQVLFNDGIVVSDAINLLTVTNTLATASNGGNIGSFNSGPMKWSLAAGGNYVFPTGRAPSKWARIGVSDLNGSTNFTAEYFMSSYALTDTSVINEPLTGVSVMEYWDLHEQDNTVDAAVTLYWEDAVFSGIVSCAPGGDLVIGHFNGAKWDDQGNSGGITGSCVGNAAGTIKSGIQTSFSPFTFGSGAGAANPLPIELLNFTALLNASGSVELSWSTVSEINNDYFTIEKTADGIVFETVGTVRGAGNSTIINNYNLIDGKPYAGVSYYRLKQTDYNGQTWTSNIITINNEYADSFYFNVFPNPNNDGIFNIQINNSSQEEVLIVVHDVLGNELYSKVLVTNQNGNDVYATDPSTKLPAGTYFISATSKQKIYNKRLIVN